MKTIKLNKSSWLYQLASQFAYDEEMTDICALTKACLKSASIIAICFVAVCCIWYVIVDLVLFVAFSLQADALIMSTITPYTLTSLLIACAFLLFVYGLPWLYQKIVDRCEDDGEPSMVRTMYDSWRHKFCVKVELVNKTKE